MNTEELFRETAANILNEMLRGSYFDICAVDKALHLLRLPRDSEEHRLLHRLHCVNWSQMPKALIQEVHTLLERMFITQPITFDFTKVVKTVEPKEGVLKRLTS